MKKILLVLTIMAGAYVTASSQIVDGGFESLTTDGTGVIFDDNTEWYVPGWLPQAVFQLDESTPKEGSQSLYFADGYQGPVKQDVSLTSGHKYRASVWIKWSPGADNLGATMFKVDIDNQETGIELNGMETEWTEYTFEFTASGSTYTMAVYRWGPDGDTNPIGEMYVDNMVLTDLGEATAINAPKLDANIEFTSTPNVFNINLADADNATVEVFSIAGQQIYSKTINGKKSTISLPQSVKGMIIIKVMQNGEVFLKKHII